LRWRAWRVVAFCSESRLRPEEACPKFEESQRLDAGLGIQFNLADCYEQLGKLASAHALFTEVAESARPTRQKEREQVARERVAAALPRASKLLIVVPTRQMAGLRVERDGVEVARAQWDVPVPVDPGVHRLRAWGPGLREWARRSRPTSDARERYHPMGHYAAWFSRAPATELATLIADLE